MATSMLFLLIVKGITGEKRILLTKSEECENYGGSPSEAKIVQQNYTHQHLYGAVCKMTF